jgi:hypothetical protein
LNALALKFEHPQVLQAAPFGGGGAGVETDLACGRVIGIGGEVDSGGGDLFPSARAFFRSSLALSSSEALFDSGFLSGGGG